MINCNGKYYLYSTGGGMMYSTDRINWTSGTSPFPSGVPTSVKNVVPNNQGIWAPDVIFYNNKYYLYYSVADPNSTNTAIGLLTSPTLDLAGAGYKWTDVGVVIRHNDKADKRTAIDPCPFVDASSNLCLSWGSGYADGATWSDPTFFISKLDNATGLRSAADLTEYPVALGHIEASYVHYRNGYYYAFWNDGGCCSGTNSTYKIHMARSANLTGPYVDKAGTAGGNVTFLASRNGQYGPGHIGILSEGGIDRFTYHYYPNGGSVVGEQTLVWGADGWPVAGTDFPAGTNKIISAANGLALGIQNASATDGTPIEQQTYTTNTYQQWIITLTTNASAPDGYYSLKSVGSGKAVDLFANNLTNGTLINEWTVGTGDNQRWFIEQTSDNLYRIVSKKSGKVIDAPPGGPLPGLQLAPTNSGLDARITFSAKTNWSYRLWTTMDLQTWTSQVTLSGTNNGSQSYVQAGGGTNAGRFWRLEGAEGSLSRGPILNAWDWYEGANQKWSFARP